MAEKRTVEVFVARAFWNGDELIAPGKKIEVSPGLASDLLIGRKAFPMTMTEEVENAKREAAVWHARLNKSTATSKAAESAERAAR
jgi:hypothetical protein